MYTRYLKPNLDFFLIKYSVLPTLSLLLIKCLNNKDLKIHNIKNWDTKNIKPPLSYFN